MGNPNDRCAGTARYGGPCTFTRAGHADGKPHAFVEPAPQPPADATSVADEFDRTDYGAGYEAGFADGRDYESSPPADAVTGDVLACSCEFPRGTCPRCAEDCLACRKSSPRASAAPYVTGDEDASLDADVREILGRRGLPDSLFPVGLNDRIASAVREALARGRELGARDENVACEKLAQHTGTRSRGARAVAKAIEARRSGSQG